MPETLRVNVLKGPFTAPLIDGAVTVRGTASEAMVADSIDASTRSILAGRADVAEISLAAYLRARADGVPIVALPIFTARRFPHLGMLIRRGSGITNCGDVRGRRVGAMQYWMTTSIWQRALLLEDFGIQPSQIVWVTASDERLSSLRIPRDVTLERVRDGRTIGQVLVDGEIDAVLVPNPTLPEAPPKESTTSPYQDLVAAQVDYFRRSTIHPTTHVVAVRATVAADVRLVGNIASAFARGKDLAVERGLPPPIADAPRDVLGADPWPFGLQANRKVIDAFVAAALEQSLISTSVTVGNLFLDV